MSTVEGNLNKDMGDEYMVAADLTLYANPLRCLQKRSKKEGEEKKEDDKKEKEKPKPPHHGDGLEHDVIAADLTKYGSPLDDREK